MVVKMMLDRVMFVDMMGAILKIILLKHNINGCHPSFEDIVAGIVTGVNCSIPHLLNVDRNRVFLDDILIAIEFCEVISR